MYFLGFCFIRSGENVPFLLDEYEKEPVYPEHLVFVPMERMITKEFYDLSSKTQQKYNRENCPKDRPRKIKYDKQYPEDAIKEYDALPEDVQQRIPFDVYVYARKKQYVFVDGALGRYCVPDDHEGRFWNYWELDKGMHNKKGELVGRAKLAEIDWNYLLKAEAKGWNSYYDDKVAIDSKDGWDPWMILPDGVEPKEDESYWALFLKLKAEKILEEDKDAEMAIILFQEAW